MNSRSINPNLASQPDESSFLAALQSGDAVAFEKLVRENGGRMLAVARRFLRNDDEAADAVQEAFISAFRNIGRFEGKSLLTTWLHRIVVNASLMKLRNRARRPDVSLDSLLPTFDHTGHHTQGVPRWRHNPADDLLAQETKQLVREAIDKLPDDFRTIVILRDLEEYSTEEAAEALGIAAGAAKVRLHRARQALRTLLEPHFKK